MSIIAAFKFDITGALLVKFTDLSSGNIVTRNWDFGDGSTSSDAEVEHLYSNPGYYNIVLSVSDGSTPPESDSYSVRIGLYENGLALGLKISEYILLGLPSTLSFNEDLVKVLIQKWQSIIGPSVIPEISNYYVELYYPILYGQLVADLVLYDLILDGAKNYLVSIGWNNGNGTQVKMITTGPATAEWFAGSDIWKSIMSAGGMFEMLISQICSTSRKLGINLHICGKFAKITITPEIYKPHKISPNYPLGWVNELLGES